MGLKAKKEGFRRVIKRAVLALVTEKLEQFPTPGKIIIYSSSIKGADCLGAVLGYKVYY